MGFLGLSLNNDSAVGCPVHYLTTAIGARSNKYIYTYTSTTKSVSIIQALYSCAVSFLASSETLRRREESEPREDAEQPDEEPRLMYLGRTMLLLRFTRSRRIRAVLLLVNDGTLPSRGACGTLVSLE
jgi:hypothetical protein